MAINAQEYLVKLGVDADWKDLDKVIKFFKSGKFQAAAMGVALTAAGKVIYNFVKSTTEAEFALVNLAKQQHKTVEATRASQNALTAMGKTMQEVSKDPALKKIYTDIVNVNKAMALPDMKGVLGNVNELRGAFMGLKSTLQYAMQWVNFHILKDLEEPIKRITDFLRKFRDGLQKNMSLWTAKIASYISAFARGLIEIANLGVKIAQWIHDLPDGVKQIGVALAFVIGLLKTGPIGMIFTLVTAIGGLMEDYDNWKKNKKDDLQPGDKDYKKIAFPGIWEILDGDDTPSEKGANIAKKLVDGIVTTLKNPEVQDSIREGIAVIGDILEVGILGILDSIMGLMPPELQTMFGWGEGTTFLDSYNLNKNGGTPKTATTDGSNGDPVITVSDGNNDLQIDATKDGASDLAKTLTNGSANHTNITSEGLPVLSDYRFGLLGAGSIMFSSMFGQNGVANLTGDLQSAYARGDYATANDIVKTHQGAADYVAGQGNSWMAGNVANQGEQTYHGVINGVGWDPNVFSSPEMFEKLTGLEAIGASGTVSDDARRRKEIQDYLNEGRAYDDARSQLASEKNNKTTTFTPGVDDPITFDLVNGIDESTINDRAQEIMTALQTELDGGDPLAPSIDSEGITADVKKAIEDGSATATATTVDVPTNFVTTNGTSSGQFRVAYILRNALGGRYSSRIVTEVAEDGDPEYIIPVKKQSRAIPLVRQMLSEMGGSAVRRIVSDLGIGGKDTIGGDLGSIGSVGGGGITINNYNTVNAPCTIVVNASGADAHQIGSTVYSASERHLIRTVKGVLA